VSCDKRSRRHSTAGNAQAHPVHLCAETPLAVFYTMLCVSLSDQQLHCSPYCRAQEGNES